MERNSRRNASEQAQGADDLLDVGKFQAVPIENLQPPAHQHVVIRHVSGRQPKLLDAGLFRDGNPDFGRQHPFQIQGDDRLFHGNRFSGFRINVERVVPKLQGERCDWDWKWAWLHRNSSQMARRKKTVVVRVPASTSNLGSGFDTLGLAVNLYNEVRLTATAGERVTIASPIAAEDRSAAEMMLEEAAKA